MRAVFIIKCTGILKKALPILIVLFRFGLFGFRDDFLFLSQKKDLISGSSAFLFFDAWLSDMLCTTA